MRILITGANGFIGSYLSKFFLEKNEEVVATSKKFHASTRKLLSEAEIIELDILDKSGLDTLNLRADVILHAATANDILSRDPAKGIELSAIGTRNILDLATRNGISKVLVFSTLQVYGSELTGRINEDSPLIFQNDYGLNHLCAELYASLFSRQGKVQTIVVRPSNVFGPIITDAFNRWSLVPGCFCKEAHESGVITIRSSGKQIRNFIHLENLSRAIEAIIHHFPDQYECYNLASSQTYSMIDVAEMVKRIYQEMYGQSLNLLIIGSTPESANQFSISLDKLNQAGFSEANEFSLDAAIRQIFNYLKSN